MSPTTPIPSILRQAFFEANTLVGGIYHYRLQSDHVADAERTLLK